jgi:hypothetical protein
LRAGIARDTGVNGSRKWPKAPGKPPGLPSASKNKGQFRRFLPNCRPKYRFSTQMPRSIIFIHLFKSKDGGSLLQYRRTRLRRGRDAANSSGLDESICKGGGNHEQGDASRRRCGETSDWRNRRAGGIPDRHAGQSGEHAGTTQSRLWRNRAVGLAGRSQSYLRTPSMPRIARKLIHDTMSSALTLAVKALKTIRRIENVLLRE